MTNYMSIANSPITFVACAVAILVVVMQSVIFMKMAWKRSLELEISPVDLKKVVKSTTIFSIVPSLAIVVGYVALMPTLGRFVPWLRLSVIGSVQYETMAATMAAESLGFTGLGDPNIDGIAFAVIFWCMTLGILTSFLSLVILKPYENQMTKLQDRLGDFGDQFSGYLVLAMMCVFLAPEALNVENPVGIITLLSATAGYFIFEWLGKKYSRLKEFVFSASMICGMVGACVGTQVLS